MTFRLRALRALRARTSASLVLETDPGYERVKQFAALLDTYKIQHVYWETQGAHVWPVWRQCLVETAYRLFQKAPPHSQSE